MRLPSQCRREASHRCFFVRELRAAVAHLSQRAPVCMARKGSVETSIADEGRSFEGVRGNRSLGQVIMCTIDVPKPDRVLWWPAPKHDYRAFAIPFGPTESSPLIRSIIPAE
jgi:hypothetical protein